MLETFYGHTVTVETYAGAGEEGDTYAAPVPVTGYLDDGLKLTLAGREDNPTGDVVESVTAFYCDIAEAATFVPESRVTVPSGAVMQVETAKRRQATAILGDVEHLEVRLR